MTTKAILIVLLVGAGCGYIFDRDQPPITLVGQAPSLTQFQKLSQRPTPSGATIVRGSDGAWWCAIAQSKSFQVVRLAEPAAEELLEATDILVRGSAFYLIDRDPQSIQPTRLTIHSAGAPASEDTVLELAPDPSLIIPAGVRDEVFLYAVLRATTTTYEIRRRDSSYVRTLPIPAGADPTDLLSKVRIAFSYDGAQLAVRDGDGRLIVYSTLDESQSDLGLRPASFFLDVGRQAVLTVGDDGLRYVPLDGSPDQVLDGAPVDSLQAYNAGYFYYIVGGVMRRVLLDGTAAPEEVGPGIERVWGFVTTGEPIISHDGPTRYTAEAGDGWIGEWNFMERGHYVVLNARERRLRWLERAARAGGVGDLLAVTLNEQARPVGPTLALGRNVLQYSDLGEGQVLVLENHAFEGPQARLVLVDENTRTARWVAPSAHRFQLIPGTQDLLVEVIVDGRTYNILRVPLPR